MFPHPPRNVCYRQSGNSLYPRIHSNDLTTYVPVTKEWMANEDDIVFCEVQPGNRFYAYLSSAGCISPR